MGVIRKFGPIYFRLLRVVPITKFNYEILNNFVKKCRMSLSTVKWVLYLNLDLYGQLIERMFPIYGVHCQFEGNMRKEFYTRV